MYRRACRLIRLGWLLLAWAAAMGGWRLYEGSFLGAALFLLACAVIAVNLRVNYRTRRVLEDEGAP